ncbi:uncharacterized protein [Acropora muricata]|uniref:uncharacterized protein n=1 Tax=Acropora muricata TaxID=159855 RepID=UPI0034E4149B
MEKITMKPHTKAFILIATIYVFAYAVKEISTQKENGTDGGSRHIKFTEDKLSYLNIGAVSRRFVKGSLHCALMCLESLPCFSFNLAAFADNNNELICEHLPSDKHNNSEKFFPSNAFHHFSIWSPCSAVVCGNNGKCVALYKENSYVCLCKEGFIGRNCETVVPECASYISLNAQDRSVHYRGRAKCDNNLETK